MQTALCLLVFLIAADSGIGSRILHTPLVACTLIGAVLGDVQTGLAVGAQAEIVAILLQMEDSGMAAFCAAVTIGVIQGGADASSILSLPVLAACAADGAVKLISTLFVPMARNAAAKGSDGRMAAANFIPLLLRGVLAASLAGYLYANASEAVNMLQTLVTDQPWLLRMIEIWTWILPFVGIAVILRNLDLKNHYGVLLAGAGTAVIGAASGSAIVFAAALIGIGIAAYDYKKNEGEKTSGTGMTEKKKGSAEKWW